MLDVMKKIVRKSKMSHSMIILGAVVTLNTSTIKFVNAACEPAPNEVAVYQHANYEGICSRLTIGDYLDSSAMRMKNDSVSSIRIGRDVIAVGCRHSWRGDTSNWRKFKLGLKGMAEIGNPSALTGCETYSFSRSSMSGTKIGNDQMSAIYVSALTSPSPAPANTRCKPDRDQISIYQHDQFKGNCRILDVGTYENSKMMNFEGDTVSSIEIGSNVYANACQHANYRGHCQNFHRTLASLKRSTVGNDSISSIEVRRR